ncbi:hypothetical protein [Desulfosporosinus sp. SB140]|uniref:hypothetical protein n=1 Tax=Desulfosporosinus paludis TaxID=3115649 RepID=UPI00388CF9F1
MVETEERIFVDAYKLVLKNATYRKHVERMIELGRKIMERLGPSSSLMLEYEISANLAKGIRLEIVYQLGVEDGLAQSKGTTLKQI